MSKPSAVRGSLWFLTRRIGASAVTVLVLVIVVFLMIKAIPGDEAKVAAGESASPEQVAAVRHQLGLDKPVIGQLLVFVKHLLHGDLGTSIATHTTVASGVAAALPPTLELVVLAMLLMVLFAFPAAVVSAANRDRSRDLVTRFSVLTLAAIPTFWLALELQNVLAAKWHVFPISGVLSRGVTVPHRTGSVMLDSLLAGNFAAFSNAFQHFLLPAFVLMIPFASSLYRAFRAELISVFARDHITVARAKGLPRRLLIRQHVVPNALGPALTILGIEFGYMIGAAVLVEAIFGINGVGSYMTTAVANKDTFAVLGCVLVIGVVVVLTNLVVDILQLLRDPRIRASQTGVS
ncbi:ABC transporter permease [Kribbella sp. NPDC059898]|uniref:ABC transporter permease n=1 Tax=Kribbella sp. NPDC059898 TaxID=3346995 RepID=UPI003647CF98